MSATEFVFYGICLASVAAFFLMVGSWCVVGIVAAWDFLLGRPREHNS